MKKRFSHKLIVASLGLLLFASPLSASAETIQSLNSQKNKLEAQSSQVERELQANQNKIHTITGKITKAQIKIGQTNTQMKVLQTKIDETTARINERKGILAEQVKASYVQNSGMDFFSLLINATSFGDFINRAYAVYRITNQQKQLIDQQINDQTSLKESKATLEQEAQETQATIQELNQLAADLQQTIQSNRNTLANLSNKRASLDTKIQTLSETVQPIVQSVSTNTPSTDSSNSTVSLSIPTINLPADTGSGTISDLINHSKKWIGNSVYVFGGGRTSYDQAHGRFDCSGFVHWAYESIGIDIGGWSTSDLQYVGRRVSPSDMKPGDLIFFNTYKTNGHVDIYIGNGQFIGSQTSTGISIQNLNSPYWKDHFSGVVRRVIN